MARQVCLVGDRYLDKRNRALASDHADLGAGLGYRGSGWELRVDGRNLTDERPPVSESELGDAQHYRLPARSRRLGGPRRRSIVHAKWLPVRRLLAPLVGAALLLAPWSGTTATTLTRVRIEVADGPRDAARLEALGFDVLRGAVAATSLELVVSEEESGRLVELGYAPLTIGIGRPFRERADAGDVPGYPDLADITQQLVATAAAHPGIARLVDLTDRYRLPPTFEGRHLHALKISDNVSDDEDEPGFLLVGNYHAREVVTPVIALDAIARLTGGYGTDPRITQLVDDYQIWIAPTFNPDGYNHVFEVDNNWRKNRRVFGADVGVDLNRNYPMGWDGGCGGSSGPGSGTYRGPGPASEAETVTMLAWSETRHFAKVLDFHSSGRETLHGYLCSSHPFAAYFEGEAILLSQESSYSGDVRAPSAEGEHYQWQLARMASHAFLTETHDRFQPDIDSARAEAERVWPGTLWLLERPIPLSGHVTDACTGAPLVAAIRYPLVTFSNGETNQSFLPFGRYHAFLPPGAHEVEFAAAGYDTVRQTVQVLPATAQLLDIQLTRSGGCPACSTGQLTPRAGLLGIKDAGGAVFEWVPDPAAAEYHLLSLAEKIWINPTDARQEPAGQGILECRSASPSCSDPDALSQPGILFYQAVSACDASQEGPI